MTNYMAQITENGKQRMAEVNMVGSVLPATVAEHIVSKSNVRDGAKVLMAELTFDYPTQSFKARSYTFDVIDGAVKNLTVVK